MIGKTINSNTRTARPRQAEGRPLVCFSGFENREKSDTSRRVEEEEEEEEFFSGELEK